MNNAGFVHGREQVGDIADADVEGHYHGTLYHESRFNLKCSHVQYECSRTDFYDPTIRQRSDRVILSFTPLIRLPTEFKAKNKGHIINLGSIAGREPYVGGEHDS